MATYTQAMKNALDAANSNLKINGNSVSVGWAINIGDALTVHANSGFAFTKNAVYQRKTALWEQASVVRFSGFDANEGEDVNINFLISDDLKSASLTYSLGDVSDSLLVSSVGAASSVVYTFTQSDIDVLVNSDVTMTVNGSNVVLGSTVEVGDVLIGTANGGSVFFTTDSPTRSSLYFHGFDSTEGSDIWREFVIAEDSLTASLTMPAPYGDVWTFSLFSSTKTVTPEVTGTNNVYLINDVILKEVNKQRFETVVGNSTVYDYGQFILSLLKLPFTIEPSLITLPENVRLATKVLTVEAPKLSTDILTFNIGSIYTPVVFNNFKDYLNTVTILHLPMLESVVLDAHYVIGETVSVFYDVDCYTGTTTVRILSSKIDDVILLINSDLGVKVPFISNQFNPPENDNIELGGDNKLRTAYIEVVRNDTILSGGLFTIPVIDESVLINQIGYIEVENIDLKTSAIRGEKDSLINLLTNGVIIK